MCELGTERKWKSYIVNTVYLCRNAMDGWMKGGYVIIGDN
jgi:hypothetical protein